MSASDPHRISDEAALRALVGEELPGVETRVLVRLDEATARPIDQAIDADSQDDL